MTFRLFCCLSLMVFPVLVFAGQGGAGGKGGAGASGDQNGGAGLPGKNGKPGMNGCPGGTLPGPDGQFYLPGTHEQCNPAQDREQKPQGLISVTESAQI